MMAETDIWKELDLDRWTWELPRDTPGPYVAEHIPKPLITDWVKKWKSIINDALEKAEKLEAVKELAVKLLAWSDDGVSWMFSEAPGEKKGDRIEYAELTKEFRELLGIKVDCEEGP